MGSTDGHQRRAAEAQGDIAAVADREGKLGVGTKCDRAETFRVAAGDTGIGRLLDGDTDVLSLSDITCFELEALLQYAAAAGPVLTYLFHRLGARFSSLFPAPVYSQLVEQFVTLVCLGR